MAGVHIKSEVPITSFESSRRKYGREPDAGIKLDSTGTILMIVGSIIGNGRVVLGATRRNEFNLKNQSGVKENT